MPDVATLTVAEIEALGGAAAWYAKYHARRVAQLADDPSAYAEARREKHRALVSGLRKLGFKVYTGGDLRCTPISR